MVKVGNSECGFLKLTPLSRISAMAGAVSGVTFSARNPSGMNRIRLRGFEFCADAIPAHSTARPADSNRIERRINISPEKRFPAYQPLPLFSFAVRRNSYIRPSVPDCSPSPQRGLEPAQRLQISRPMFKRILIANRGEIACRVIKTARRMGLETVAGYSEADRDALHVEMADKAGLIGPPAAAESYLVMAKIVEACRKTGAQAVHPGYGFLSDRAAFPPLLLQAALLLVAPNPPPI